MPFRFICSKCGSVLLEAGEEILRYQTTRNACRHGQNTPAVEAFIARKIGRLCPFCGHKLATRPLNIEVYPIKRQRMVEARSNGR